MDKIAELRPAGPIVSVNFMLFGEKGGQMGLSGPLSGAFLPLKTGVGPD